jgi:hypothetical protein
MAESWLFVVSKYFPPGAGKKVKILQRKTLFGR